MVRRTGVRAVQVYTDDPDDVATLADLGVTVIRAAIPLPGRPVPTAGGLGEDLLLLDSPAPGSGHAWDPGGSGGVPSGRWILAGGLRPETVGDAVTAWRPWGVDVSSGVESERGVKDHGLIREFVARARSAGAG